MTPAEVHMTVDGYWGRYDDTGRQMALFTSALINKDRPKRKHVEPNKLWRTREEQKKVKEGKIIEDLPARKRRFQQLARDRGVRTLSEYMADK